jgi:hypothetical protein
MYLQPGKEQMALETANIMKLPPSRYRSERKKSPSRERPLPERWRSKVLPKTAGRVHTMHACPANVCIPCACVHPTHVCARPKYVCTSWDVRIPVHKCACYARVCIPVQACAVPTFLHAQHLSPPCACAQHVFVPALRMRAVLRMRSRTHTRHVAFESAPEREPGDLGRVSPTSVLVIKETFGSKETHGRDEAQESLASGEAVTGLWGHGDAAPQVTSL